MILQHIIFFGAGFSLLLGVQQFLDIRNSLNKWTGILFLSLSWGLFRALLYDYSLVKGGQVTIPLLTSVVAAAIAIQAYFRIILKKEDENSVWHKIYIILFVLSVIADVLIIIFIGKIRNQNAGISVLSIIHLAGGAFLITALVRFVFTQGLILFRRPFSFSVFYVFSISVSVLILTVFGLIGALFNLVLFGRLYSIGFTVLLIFIFFLSKIRPEILIDLGREAIKMRYRRSSLTGVDKQKIRSGLDNLMENEKTFTDDACSLDMLADKLGLTRHQLSEYLNKDLNTGFSAYINSFRIKMVIKKLEQSSDTTILEAAFEAGFGNKSSFNEAFRKEIGMTPREFRKKSQEL